MINSMTGFGKGEHSAGGISVVAEIRSVNSKFLEVSARMPRSLSLREGEVKELIRKRVSRGKINLLISVERENDGALPLKINLSAAKAYYQLLNQLRKAVRLTEKVKLEHLLQFSEVLEQRELEGSDEQEWEIVKKALALAIDDLQQMRSNEGGELEVDLRNRIALLEVNLNQVEVLSKEQVPHERTRLRERIGQLLEKEKIDEGRLEQEIVMLADRLDVTEETVRFRSHNKFFLTALASGEPSGRRLNFLVQEMNREVNTIGSKSSDTRIAHLVVGMKEELEKIREQLQNVE